MEFEPVICTLVAGWVQTGFEPFEPLKEVGRYVRNLTRDLTVIRSITARTGKPEFARAVSQLVAKAPDLGSVHRKGDLA